MSFILKGLGTFADGKPMTDSDMLIPRLRAGRFSHHLNQAAADEIEKLRLENFRLRKAIIEAERTLTNDQPELN
jgi:signal transduction histidine kinase